MEAPDLARRWAAAPDPRAAIARVRADLVAADDARLPAVHTALGIWVAILALSPEDALASVRGWMREEIENPAAAGVIDSAELSARRAELEDLRTAVAAADALVRDGAAARAEQLRLMDEAERQARRRAELERELSAMTRRLGGPS